MSEVKRSPCPYCLNARSDPDGELMDSNDLSYLSVGSVDPVFSSRLDLSIRSGDGRPVAIIFSAFSKFLGSFDTVAIYLPKFCPECGRPLMADYPEKRSLYGI